MDKGLKDKILKLRNKGESYDQIAKELRCSKGTISYHCNENVREYYKDRRRKNRRRQKTDLKEKYGGKCSVCGYDRCLDALAFHHVNPEYKTGTIGLILYSKGKRAAYEEAKQCVLLCANCHAEVHNGLIKL